MRWLHGKLALIISASLALTLFTEIETAIFVGLAIALVTLTIYWVRRLPG